MLFESIHLELLSFYFLTWYFVYFLLLFFVLMYMYTYLRTHTPCLVSLVYVSFFHSKWYWRGKHAHSHNKHIMHAYTRTYIHAYVHACIHTCVCVYICTYAWTHTYTCTNVHTYVYTYARMYVRTTAQTHTHTERLVCSANRIGSPQGFTHRGIVGRVKTEAVAEVLFYTSPPSPPYPHTHKGY